MLKSLNTLVRGSIAEIEEGVFDANAVRLLEEQDPRGRRPRSRAHAASLPAPWRTSRRNDARWRR